MARTRDRRPSADAEERQFTVEMNGHENHRVYEENEWSAAEALMGINASPTTSHANEPAPSTTSTTVYSRRPPSPLILQRPQRPQRSQRRPSVTSRPSTSTNGRRRTRGNTATSDSAPVEDTDTSTTNSAQDHGHIARERFGDVLAEPHNTCLPGHSVSVGSNTFRRPNGLESERQIREDSILSENGPNAQILPSRPRRKRKRSESVSVAAVSRGQLDGTSENGLPRENGEYTASTDGVSQTHSEPQTPALDASMPTMRVRAQNEAGGPSNLKAEASINGTNGRKAKPRNFDKVVFGRWLIKTWYYSPYPIQTTEDDNGTTPAGQNRQSSGNRTQQSKRASTSARTRQRLQNAEDSAPAEESMLWVCDRCFKYMQDGSLYEMHSKFCDRMRPPGRKVYERGAHIIYEVDGAKDKLYCQNLSLFGKLFIDIKTLFYDCENFMFYVLAEVEKTKKENVIGFFSKEKVSYDDYNLACIITFPPYQRKRFGMLMIEFSYELSRRAGKLGTPERPLSELGLRTYLTYWTGALVRFFRRVLSVQPLSDIPRDQQRPVDDDLIRFIEAQDSGSPKKRKKSGKDVGDNSYKNRIWEDRLENRHNTGDIVATTNGSHDALYKHMRWMRTSANPDGSATTHVFARCTLEDIANATGIRTEDIAFTLHECGLLQRIQALDPEETEEVIIISREMIEQVAREFKVKEGMVMEMRYVLLK